MRKRKQDSPYKTHAPDSGGSSTHACIAVSVISTQAKGRQVIPAPKGQLRAEQLQPSCLHPTHLQGEADKLLTAFGRGCYVTQAPA